MTDRQFAAPHLIARALADGATAFVLPVSNGVSEISQFKSCENIGFGIWQWSNNSGEVLLSLPAPFSPGDVVRVLEEWSYDFERDTQADANRSLYKFKADWPDAKVNWHAPSGMEARTRIAVKVCRPINLEEFDPGLSLRMGIGASEKGTAEEHVIDYVRNSYPAFTGEWFWLVECTSP